MRIEAIVKGISKCHLSESLEEVYWCENNIKIGYIQKLFDEYKLDGIKVIEKD